ncbi:MAG TPA: ABC transporter ATP-binding protein [Elusimicrobiota bacterium]|jgi:branched-chain amino acid transport system ATP-binding protein|nr:ABC transporter ATP-binding protein [Elusimicrobiota bacterium]
MLRLEGVHAVYGRKIRALKGVDLEVRAGEIVALIGNNGAGKTTMMHTIAGLLKPEKGRVTFQGRDIGGLAPDRIMRMGLSLVPEGRRIFPRLTVMENLEMGAYARPRGTDLAREYDHVFRLFPVLGKRRPQLGGTLSGGEQQMLAMGRALMSAPKLLMLDEPSMGLAPVVVDKIFEIIELINKEGVTVLLVEQNAKRALRAAARGYVLETGEIVAARDTASLTQDPAVRRAYLGLA